MYSQATRGVHTTTTGEGSSNMETLGHELATYLTAHGSGVNSALGRSTVDPISGSGGPVTSNPPRAITSPYCVPVATSSMQSENSRSVVLALRGLQDKIQHLENERNHYKSAYEQCLSLHDAKLSSLRAAHEEEKQRLLNEVETQLALSRKAMTERVSISAELEEERLVASRQHAHLEHIIQTQKQRLERCEEDREREGTALVEAQECINQVRDQSRELERQRDAAENTAQQLSDSLKQLVTLNTNLVDRVAQLHLAVSMAAADAAMQEELLAARANAPGANPAPRYTSQTISSLNRSRDLSPLTSRQNPVLCGSVPPNGKATRNEQSCHPVNGNHLNVTQLISELESEYQELLAQLKSTSSSMPQVTATPGSGTDTSLSTAHISQLLNVLERKAEQIACLRRLGARQAAVQERLPAHATQRSASAGYLNNAPCARAITSPVRASARGSMNHTAHYRDTSPVSAIKPYIVNPRHATPTCGTRGVEKKKATMQTLHELRSLVQNHSSY